MTESFTTGAGGLPGNDDLGATSAWYVWSAMGMYPPTPGADTIALHGALFPSILIDRPSGDIQINATNAGPTNQYVQSVSVNGTATQKTWLRYGDIANGATISYTMGSTASNWGTDPANVPPSFNDGWTPPSAAPDLGTNLAAGKSATGSAACNSSEGPEKAVDAKLGAASKWCSTASGTKFLQVDLGSNQRVSSFVVKHAGLGGETTGWNTGAFTIQTSTDGTNWTTQATVSGNRTSRTYHPITATTARYVKLNVTTPTNTTDTAARIDEFEVYGGGASNLARNHTATADSQCNADESPAKAVNGSVSGGSTDKWCSAGASKWLQVDLGASHAISSFTIRHAGAGGETNTWDTKDYDLQVSAAGSTWTTVVQARGNTADVSSHGVSATGRYVRLNVVTPAQTTDAAARIYEFEVYGT